MLVKLRNNMKFKSLNADEVDNHFEVIKFDYYDDGEEIWCATTDKIICPLSEIDLSAYMPCVDGVWINEHNEYEE